MEPISLSVNEGFDRLQRLLLTMRAGDDLKAADAAEVTGLNETVCLAVLEGLARAGLMVHDGDDRFVRKTLELMDT
jgi:DNA-binding IclR family transcriptional regulator